MAPPPPVSPSRCPALEQAYRQTWYWVEAAPNLPAQAPVQAAVQKPASGLQQRWKLQIGHCQPLLQTGYRHHGCAPCACYLTACNPLGRLLSAEENQARMQQLRDALLRERWPLSPGFGQDPQGLWPGESSLLVWGMAPDTACHWGRRFEQNAVLCCDASGMVHLQWL